MGRPKFVAVMVATAAVGIAVIASPLSQAASRHDLSGGTLRIADSSGVNGWYGFDGLNGYTNLNQPQMSAVYDSLMRWDGSWERPNPSVASSWAYNKAHTVLTLHLRTDVTFQDGTHLDANVVKANLDAERTTGVEKAFYSAIKNVAVTGPSTVVINLSHPDPVLLQWLCAQPLISAYGLANQSTLATTPAGSGPYILSNSSGGIPRCSLITSGVDLSRP